jgi:predicted dehydrogenase
MDLGCYAVYCAVGLFGAPTTVSYAATMLPTGVDSGGVLTLRYEGEGQALSKPHVTLIISKSSHSFNHSEIQTENGTIRINNLGDWSDVHLQKKGGQPENIGVEHNPNNMVYELEAFIKLVQKGQQEDELLTWSLAREVLTVLDQARASAGIVYPADSN